MRLHAVSATLLVLLALAGVARAAEPVGVGQQETGNGRQLHPVGALTTLGDFPSASALTPDGRFLWAVDSGHGKDDVDVVDVHSGKVVQVLPLPGGYGGVGFTPDGTRAFVSGSPISSDTPEGPTKGDKGDVLHVFDVDPATGRGTEREPVALPSSSGGAGQTQSLPPVQALYPAGLSVSPDGRTVAVALQQADRVALVPVGGGPVRTVAVGRYPATTAFDRDGRAFVSNAFDGTVSVVDVGAARVLKTIGGLGGLNAQPEGMVADPRTDRLYVAVTQRDTVATIDTRSLSVVRTTSVGRKEALGVQPTALAVDPDGSTLYVADSNEDAVAAIALVDRPATASAARRATRYRPPNVAALQRYDALLALEGRRYRRERGRAHAAAARRRATRAHAARVTSIHLRVLKTARVAACGGPTKRQARAFRAGVLAALRGSLKRRPAALQRVQHALPAIVACAGGQGAIAGLKAGQLIGKLPVAAYPTSVQVTPDGSRLLWVAGKGFGSGPNPDFVFAGDKRAFGKVQTPYGSYVLDKLLGRLGRLDRPTDTQVRTLTPAAEQQAVPAGQQAPPAGTVVRKGGPIQHVFYIVRENRTYDQVFGSEPRGDGDRRLELFDDNGVAPPLGGITPNAHALARTFPLLDHFFADSEVSVDGHLITAGSIANDYTQKATAQNYSRPGKSFDFGVYPITFGPNDFVFDQAVRQGVTFRNYGEQAAGIPFGSEGRSTYAQVVANSDLAYPGNLQIGCLAPSGQIGDVAACTQDSGVTGVAGTASAIPSRYNDFAASLTSELAAGSVPAFNYLILPNDHTNGTTTGAYTPQADIADNDLGLGQIVDLISHSAIWGSTAIFVVEDDSQDGADHVDAHRMPAFVISPWARRHAVVSTRYDQYSALRTAELLAGLDPLSINDALATPMYDAFDTTPDVEGTRYTAIRPQQSLTEVNGANAPLAALSRALPFETLDLVPQAVLDHILWASAHGAAAVPPKPGPDASSEEHERAIGALRAVARGADARAWLREHTAPDPDDEPTPQSGAAPRAASDDEESAGGADEAGAASGDEDDDRPVEHVRVTAAVRSAAAAQARRALDDLGAG